MNVIIKIVELTSKQIKDLAFQLNKEVDNMVLVIGNKDGAKAGLTVMISESNKDRLALNARGLIKEISPLIQGGGGGQDYFATAGGKNQEGIIQALDLARNLIESHITVQ